MSEQGMNRVVLVVDDDPIYRLLVRNAVEELGHAVMDADSTEAGLARAEALHDAGVAIQLISDYRLPGLDGIEGVALARRRFSSITRAMILTSHSDMMDRAKAWAAGVDDIQCKPEQPGALSDLLRDFLSAGRTQAEFSVA